MELRDVLVVLRIRWRTVVVSSSLALVAALVYSLTASPVYVARSSLFLSVSVGQSSGQLSRGFAYAQNLAVLYSRVAAQPVVLEPVVRELGLEVTPAQLSRSVVARNLRDTVVIEIEVRGSDPRQAARIADAVAERLSTAVGELLPSSGGDPRTGMVGAVPVRLTVVAPAAVPNRPEGPQVGLNAILGLAVGLSVGVALALLRDVMSGRVDHRGLGRLAQAPVIATMPRARGARGARAGAFRRTAAGRFVRPRTPDGWGAAGESGDEVLQLRAGFEHLRIKRGLRTVVFTSAFDDEATGTVVFELAHALARAGIRVLLVDADLRRPDLDRRCGRRATVGLTSVVQGLMPWSDVVVQLGWELPDLLPAGPPADDPGAVLGNGLLTGALREAAERYDVVLVRAPAAPRVADGLLLVAGADGTVLVVERRSSSREGLREYIDGLRLVSAQVVGVVLV